MSSRVFVSFGEGKVVSVLREPKRWRPSRVSPYKNLFRSDGSVTETQKQKATLMGGQGALNGWTGSIQWEDREHSMDEREGFDDGQTGSIGWVDREHLMGGWGTFNRQMGSIQWWVGRERMMDGQTWSTRWVDGEHLMDRQGGFISKEI